MKAKIRAKEKPLIRLYVKIRTEIKSLKAMKQSKIGGKLLLGLVLFFNVSVFGAALNGNYTIGASSADYVTIQDAVTDLVNNGVSGPCVFEIQDGLYSEQIYISEIFGTSSTNSIVFKSESNDANKVQIEYSSSTSLNYVVKIDKADFISFQSLSFEAKSTVNPRIFKLWEGVSDVSWKSCVFNSAVNSSFVNSVESIISGETSTLPNEHLTIEDCSFTGGSFGIHFIGLSSNRGRNVKVLNSKFFDQGSGAIKLHSYRGGEYSNNIINLDQGSGIDLNTDSSTVVSGNKIEILSTTVFGLGINISNHSSSLGMGYVEMKNNVIKVDFGTGIKAYNSDYFLMYHNTVLTKNIGTYFSLDVSLCDTFDISNNIFINDANYTSVKLEGNLGKNEYMNFNCIYSQSNQPFLHDGQFYTFSNWKGITGKDSESVFRDVYFIDENDLEIDCSEATHILSNRDLTLSVPKDFKGETRPRIPVIGAFEAINSTGLVTINGYVISGTDTIKNGNIKVFGDTSNLVGLDYLGAGLIDADGSFSIDDVPIVDCWIKIFPDPIQYPQYLNSYHDGAIRFEDAIKLELNECDGLTVDLHPRKMIDIVFDGDGSISGFISKNWSGSSKTLGTDPIPGLDVVLDKIPPTKTVAKVKTDLYGKYTFGNLPEGTYQVSIEYNGLPIDTLYEVNIKDEDTLFTHLDYCIDTTNLIEGCYSEIQGNNEVVSFSGLIYPNPFQSNIMINDLSLVNEIKIVNVEGKYIRSLRINQDEINIDLGGLKNGVYFIEFIYGNDLRSYSKIIKHK